MCRIAIILTLSIHVRGSSKLQEVVVIIWSIDTLEEALSDNCTIVVEYSSIEISVVVDAQLGEVNIISSDPDISINVVIDSCKGIKAVVFDLVGLESVVVKRNDLSTIPLAVDVVLIGALGVSEVVLAWNFKIICILIWMVLDINLLIYIKTVIVIVIVIAIKLLNLHVVSSLDMGSSEELAEESRGGAGNSQES